MKIHTFRIATNADSESIAELVNQAYRPKLRHPASWTHESDLLSGNRINAQQIVEILSKPDSMILVGTKAAEIMACVQVEKNGNDSYIGMLAVHPMLQGAGVGSQLLTQAEQYALEVFEAKKFIMVVVSARSELISFYIRRGYRQTGNIMDYPILKGVGIPKNPNLKIEILEKQVLSV